MQIFGSDDASKITGISNIVHDFNDQGSKPLAVAGSAILTYPLPPGGGKNPAPNAPSANTVGFVYVLNFGTCTMLSSLSYNKFNNMGIRSVELSASGGGLAMLAYDTPSGPPGTVANEYLILTNI